jgi:hypothetical protein
MATLAVENWTATSTTAWPSQWTAGINNGTASVASSRGRLTPDRAGYRSIRRLLTGVTGGASSAQRRITGTFIPSALTEQYVKISGREQTGTTGDYPSGYYVQVNVSANTWQILGGYATGSYGDAAAVPLTLVAGRAFGFTIDVTGYTTSARLWDTTLGSEPTGWQSTWTDADSGTASGVPALSHQSGNTTTGYVEFGPVTVTDGVDAAAPSYRNMMMAF